VGSCARSLARCRSALMERPLVTLPSGKQVRANNGDRGFFARGVHTLRCQEGWKQFLPWKYVCLEDRAEVGKKWADIFPQKLDVSKSHVTVGCLNNYYFVKDGSKKGTYIRLHGHKQNKRVELHKGMTFSVGRVQFKVSNIEGDAVDNRELKAQMEKEAAERAAKAAEDEGAGKKKDAELESDEEFADDSDDDDKGKSSGKKSKLDGPPVMFLSTLDKKKPIRGRIRETSTIGSDKEKNKIAIPEEVAKVSTLLVSKENSFEEFFARGHVCISLDAARNLCRRSAKYPASIHAFALKTAGSSWRMLEVALGRMSDCQRKSFSRSISVTICFSVLHESLLACRSFLSNLSQDSSCSFWEKIPSRTTRLSCVAGPASRLAWMHQWIRRKSRSNGSIARSLAPKIKFRQTRWRNRWAHIFLRGGLTRSHGVSQWIYLESSLVGSIQILMPVCADAVCGSCCKVVHTLHSRT